MERSIKVIKEIESSHKGLGVPIVFGNYCSSAKLSIFYVGEVGTGKGTTIRAIRRGGVDENLDLTVNTLTLTEMCSRIGYCHNSAMLWRIPEWSTLSKYHRELFLTVGSHVITDKEYFHQLGEKKGLPIVVDIKNTTLTVLIGIQPLKMSKMMSENENWESLASDRFLKFALFNPLRDDSVEEPPHYKIPSYTYNPTLEISTSMTLIQRILSKQISRQRLPIFCRHLLRAFACFEGYDSVTLKAEIELVKLVKPYLQLYPKMIYAFDIAEEKKFAVGAYRLFLAISEKDGITMEDLKDEFRVYKKIKSPSDKKHSDESYQQMIMRHAELLMDSGLIEINRNSPISFHLAPMFREYFDWYKEITK